MMCVRIDIPRILCSMEAAGSRNRYIHHTMRASASVCLWTQWVVCMLGPTHNKNPAARNSASTRGFASTIPNTSEGDTLQQVVILSRHGMKNQYHAYQGGPIPGSKYQYQGVPLELYSNKGKNQGLLNHGDGRSFTDFTGASVGELTPHGARVLDGWRRTYEKCTNPCCD